VHLQEVLAVKVEAAEMKREGKPGTETAGELGELAWYALFARKFRKSLAAADRTKKKLGRSTLVTRANPSRARVGYFGIPSSSRILPNSARRV
jgi:hypothetical protein